MRLRLVSMPCLTTIHISVRPVLCLTGSDRASLTSVYRPALSRRLTRLEKKLDLPADERHISYASLNTCETRELAAPRVPDNMGQAKWRARTVDRDREREASLGMGDEDPGQVVQQVGKSVWHGVEGEVTVEGWVLEWWQKKGYKGYHSESSILTTLFALLLWPPPIPTCFGKSVQTFLRWDITKDGILGNETTESRALIPPSRHCT